jgi:hypothetical protein
MFSGPEYHNEFEQARRELPGETDPDVVGRRLMNVEWVLWEALRGAFGRIALIIAALVVLPPAYILEVSRSWKSMLVALAILLLLTVSTYWLCRAVFHYEIARHVRGRRFGEGGFGQP